MDRQGGRPTGTQVIPTRLARLAGILLLASSPFAACHQHAPVPVTNVPPATTAREPNAAPSPEAPTPRVDDVAVNITRPEDVTRESAQLSSLLSQAEALGQERIMAAHKLPF